MRSWPRILLSVDLQRSASRLLAESRVAALTYPEVGATAHQHLPTGYRHLRRHAIIGDGDQAFTVATQTLLNWRMHRQAGLKVSSTVPVAEPGGVVVLGAGVPPLQMLAPCRVIYVVTEKHRRGFAYGTLRGHPEIGEEAFLIEQQPDGKVVLHITAFARPGTWYARLGGPLTHLAQDLMTRRYIRAFRRGHKDRAA